MSEATGRMDEDATYRHLTGTLELRPERAEEMIRKVKRRPIMGSGMTYEWADIRIRYIPRTRLFIVSLLDE